MTNKPPFLHGYLSFMTRLIVIFALGGIFFSDGGRVRPKILPSFVIRETFL